MNNMTIIVCAGVIILVIAIVSKLWTIRLIVPLPPPYKQGVGLEYAMNLADRTQRLSLLLIVVGWILVSSGVLLVTVGAILGSKPVEEGNQTVIAVLISQRGLVCAALAVVFGGIGWQCIYRSKSATKAASVATVAIATATIESNGEQDIKAYKACVQAKSAWLEGRMNQDLLQSIVNKLNKPTKDIPSGDQPSDT